MKKHTIKMTAAFLMLAATLGSCTKGSKGDTGPQGPAGTNGTNGTNGVVNVHSGTVTLTASNWSYNSSYWEYSSDVADVDITTDVVDNGTVSAFIQNSTGVWEAMPLTIYSTSTQSYTYTYQFYSGGVTFFFDVSDNSTFSLATVTFKVVAISGTTRKAHPNTNWKNYDEVMAVVNNSAPAIR